MAAQANRLALKNVKVDSFAGISKTEPIIISFAEGQRFLKAEGDQGTNKTSTLEALKALLGANIAPNAINSIDDDRKAASRFVGKDGLLYQVKITRSTFALENIVTDDKGEPILEKGKERTREEKKPKALLRQLVGPLGISPMELKTKDAAEQIAWLQSHSTGDAADIKKKQEEIEAKGKVAYDKRTIVNRDIKNLSANLDKNDFIISKDVWAEKFKALEGEAAIQEKITLKKADADKYIRGEERVKTLQSEEETITLEISTINKEIERLTNLRSTKTTKLTEVLTAIKAGKAFLDENKQVAEEVATLETEMREIGELKVKKVSYDQAIVDEQKRTDLQKEQAELTTAYKTATQELTEYLKSFAPNIEGLEILVATEEDPRNGLYFRGKNVDQLCESELWEMCLLIWAAFDVSVVFVENLNGLGSNAIERLNWFVENGGYVFATEMDRAEKDIRISVNTKINL